jgi:hypothetical protein
LFMQMLHGVETSQIVCVSVTRERELDPIKFSTCLCK